MSDPGYIITKAKKGLPKAYLKVSQRDGTWQWTENECDVWVFYSHEKEQAYTKAKKYRGKVEILEDV